MTNKKANVTTADVDTLYIDGKDVYRLIRCESEPHAVMELIADGSMWEKPISEFVNFVRLKPEHPIVKPVAPRKTRSDKGSHKPKPEQAAATIQTQEETPTPEKAVSSSKKKAKQIIPLVNLSDEGLAVSVEPLSVSGLKREGLPDISTFSIKSPEPGTPNISILTIGEVAVACKTLTMGVKELLGACGIDQKYIEDAPDSEGKRNLLDILNPTPDKKYRWNKP